MSLRRRLAVYVIGLHVVFFAFTITLYRDNPLLFVVLELLLLISLGGGFFLIGRALEPLAHIRRFHELLQDRNFATRLKDGEEGELSESIKLFNALLDTLYRERMDLGEQRGLLEHLLEATPSAVLAFDFDGCISLMNASALALLGLENAKGRPLAYWLQGEGMLSNGFDETARARSLSLLAQLDTLPPGEGRVLTVPEGRRYRGQRMQFYDRGFARHFLLVEELTEELESSERAAYEKLIRVLAHEVNNTVAATNSVLDSLLFYRSQLHEQDVHDFTIAIAAVKRRNVSLGEFIERFTRVVKMPAPALHEVSIPDMMEDIVSMHRELCRSCGISIEWTCRDSVPAQSLDRHLMEQALINIVKNAIEAVQAALEENASANAYVHLELAMDAEGVRLSVIDSGRRLGATPSAQLFTLFYSTKKGGQGIGLMFVREVLGRHNCTYRLAPNVQGDTSFDIWFH